MKILAVETKIYCADFRAVLTSNFEDWNPFWYWYCEWNQIILLNRKLNMKHDSYWPRELLLCWIDFWIYFVGLRETDTMKCNTLANHSQAIVKPIGYLASLEVVKLLECSANASSTSTVWTQIEPSARWSCDRDSVATIWRTIMVSYLLLSWPDSPHSD